MLIEWELASFIVASANGEKAAFSVRDTTIGNREGGNNVQNPRSCVIYAIKMIKLEAAFVVANCLLPTPKQSQ